MKISKPTSTVLKPTGKYKTSVNVGVHHSTFKHDDEVWLMYSFNKYKILQAHTLLTKHQQSVYSRKNAVFYILMFAEFMFYHCISNLLILVIQKLLYYEYFYLYINKLIIR